MLGVKKFVGGSAPRKLKELDFEMEKKQAPKSSRRETSAEEEGGESTRWDRTRGSAAGSEEDPFVSNRRQFAGSNFGQLQPNYGVQIKENERVKTGSYAFKEHFKVMSRAEYDSEYAVRERD